MPCAAICLLAIQWRKGVRRVRPKLRRRACPGPGGSVWWAVVVFILLCCVWCIPVWVISMNNCQAVKVTFIVGGGICSIMENPSDPRKWNLEWCLIGIRWKWQASVVCGEPMVEGSSGDRCISWKIPGGRAVTGSGNSGRIFCWWWWWVPKACVEAKYVLLQMPGSPTHPNAVIKWTFKNLPFHSCGDVWKAWLLLTFIVLPNPFPMYDVCDCC